MRTSGHTAPEPLSPRPRLIAVACRYERHQCKGRISQPAVAVIPIASPPSCSGSEVVRAATMPPVSAYLSVNKERLTGSRKGPTWEQRLDQPRQNDSVSWKAAFQSISGGVGR